MLQNTQNCPFCPGANLSSPTLVYIHSLNCEDYGLFLQISTRTQDKSILSPSPTCNKPEVEECTSTCKICFNNYDEKTFIPKILPNCGHTFCKKCLTTILNENFRLRCPVCRYVYMQSVDQLPTNLALLELTGKWASTDEMCRKHSMKLMAYCEDDKNFLCGACILDHKNHNCKLLTDASLNSTAEKIRQKLMARLEILNARKVRLNIENIDLCNKIYQIETEIFNHEAMIDHAKYSTIHLFNTNLQKCLKEAGECEDWDKLETVNMCYDFNIKLFTDDIQRIEEKLQRFEKLSIVEKLESIKLNSVQKEFISVNEIAEKILEQKMKEINYFESLKNGRIIFENQMGI